MNPYAKYAFALGFSFISPQVAADVVRVDGGVPYFNSTGKLVIDGVRVIGQTSGLLDSFRLIYNLNKETLDLSLVGKVKFQGIGIFSQWMFAKNVINRQPSFSYAGKTYPSDQFVTLGSNQSGIMEISYRLEAGHSISYLIDSPSTDVKYRFYGPGYTESAIFTGNIRIITNAKPAFRAGTYKFRLESLNKRPFTMRFLSFNANNRRLITLSNGSTINDSFRSNIRDYSKYRINLRRGDILKLDHPPHDIEIQVVNKYGGIVINNIGIPVTIQADYSGLHYIFIRNYNAAGGSYFSNVTVLQNSPPLDESGGVANLDEVVVPGGGSAPQ